MPASRPCAGRPGRWPRKRSRRCHRAVERRRSTTTDMKFKYTKYTGDLLDEIDLEDLVSKLSDMLLSSGFSNPWGDPSAGDEDRTLQALHDAILEALFSGGVLSEDALQQLLGDPADADQEAARQQLEELIQQIIDRMMEQGFITGAPDLEKEREQRR